MIGRRAGSVKPETFDLTLAIRLAYTPARMQPHNNLTIEYAAQAGELERLVAEASAETIVNQPGENRWSILQIVCHLADAELLASARVRRLITQDRPKMWGYQQEVWADRLDYQQRKVETVLARFALLRRENAELLDGLPATIWQQTGDHDLYGTLSLQQLIEDYLVHTSKHLDQIKQLLGND